MRAFLLAAFLVGVNIALAVPASAAATAAPARDDTFTEDEIVKSASDFFSMGSETVAKAVEDVFRRHGRPNAYIVGTEGSGAIGVGLRYGDGNLVRKGWWLDKGLLARSVDRF